jgi:carboxyl-terminal processing protease
MYNRSTIFRGAFNLWLCLLFSVAVIQSSCRKDNTKPNYPDGSNENINTWILDSLERYYYWRDAIPSRPGMGMNPKDFFASVRNSADRFSFIVLPGDRTTYPPAGTSKFGFDYSTIAEGNTNKTIGVVKQVLAESPASRAGLKRGDYICKINGQELTASNAQSLEQDIIESDQFTLTLAEIKGNIWAETRLVEINAGVILDQRQISNVIETDGKKIGYLTFHDFSPGLAASLLETFAGFKSAGVSDLILDLRYNSGGQVAEAAALCAMIAPGVTYDKPFITYMGNKNGGTKTESIGAAATFDGTVNFNILLKNNLGLNRVFILSTGATASASEVMINNLKPFMPVVLIGEKTIGKDEASFTITDARIPKQVKWEMHPIVYKLFNAAGSGNYSAGINPDISVNEFASLPLLPFGDVADPLVRASIARITGKGITSASGKASTASNLYRVAVITDSHVFEAQNSVVITHR